MSAQENKTGAPSPASLESERLRLEAERLALEKERLDARAEELDALEDELAEAGGRSLQFGAGAVAAAAFAAFALGVLLGGSVGFDLGVRRAPPPRTVSVGPSLSAALRGPAGTPSAAASAADAGADGMRAGIDAWKPLRGGRRRPQVFLLR